MVGHKGLITFWVKTIKKGMSNGITEKRTKKRFKFQFFGSVKTKSGIIKPTKNTKRSVIRIVMEQL